MDLVIGTVLLRPYVFGFLVVFTAAALADLGGRRTLRFAASVWPVAWLAEYSSTRVGLPFGLYHYTEATRGQELYIANVPFFDSLSFVFLAYAAFCVARLVVGRAPGPLTRVKLALIAGMLMMVLDMVIDPIAVRGDRWFLGRVFYYAEEGSYFGVPLSNFAGWVAVGAAGVGLYLWGAGVPTEGRVWPGLALYYGVLAFNVMVTLWIGEWALATTGLLIHTAVAVGLRAGYQRRGGQARPMRKDLQEV
ncbi:MAG: carotenoid biosynthesis protein [Candidatus Rokuibacteriota bacterium]